MTTVTCIADYLSWSGYSATEKIELGKLYVPYLALGTFFRLPILLHHLFLLIIRPTCHQVFAGLDNARVQTTDV